MLILCLSAGCSSTALHSESTIPDQPVISQTTPPESTIPETEVTTETFPTQPATDSEHSELYISGVCVEDVILYFNEVCLDAEFVNSGNASLLQKWITPIHYTLYGEYTAEDLAVLSSFTDWLNTIDGFPGIFIATTAEDANLRIHFCSQSDMIDLMGDQFLEMDGAVTFWYSDDAIYDAVICYRTDLDQHLRNSVILEEIYNGLGPIQDTALRPDSIIYQEFSETQQLSPMDALILQLLYHPSLLPGMDSYACETAIRSLYY